MTHLRAAVDRQRGLLIAQLIKTGAFDPADKSVHRFSITELLEEYERSMPPKKENLP